LSYKHLAAGLLALAASFAAFSHTVTERSPFLQGHWWDPARNGSGFEIFNVGTEGAAIWYTYENDGRAVWYTAQGQLDGSAWTLVKHSWKDGRKQAGTSVGRIALTVKHANAITAAFTIGAASGSWNLEPLMTSGVPNEIDHSGSYFDPANSGWGFTFTEQGDVKGGVLYSYDASGAPVWFAGFDRGATDSVNLFTGTGACPTCAYTPSSLHLAGPLRFQFDGEAAMTVRNGITAPMAAGTNIDGAKVVQLGRRASSREADRQLALFDTEAALRTAITAAYLNTGNYYGPPGDFSSPPPSAPSTTNVQEAGVDEADSVKANATHVYSPVVQGTGASAKTFLRTARVGPTGAILGFAALTPLYGGLQGYAVDPSLILDGKRLVSIGSLATVAYYSYARTVIEQFGLDAEGIPRSEWTAEISGLLVSTRRIGDRLYVVTRHGPAFDVPYGDLETRHAAVQARATDDFLPKISINGKFPTTLVGPGSMYLPPLGSRIVDAITTVVTMIDLTSHQVQALGVLRSMDAVYVTPSNLYLAGSRYGSGTTTLAATFAPFVTTDVHQISLAAGGPVVAGTGTVEGRLQGGMAEGFSFGLNERAGRLSIVTTNDAMWGADRRNRLTIIEPSSVVPGLLKTVSYLPNAQRPEPLGKPFETVRGVRFLGDRLFVVTFRTIDPLYVIDLSNAADPKITGSVTVPGFSGYLHPLPNNLLLGFGPDTNASGFVQGLQLSLYDVADANNPRELKRVPLGGLGTMSALQNEHHAFSIRTNPDGTYTVGIPARVYESDGTYSPVWVKSGLTRFNVGYSALTGGSLTALPMLVTHWPGSVPPSQFYDDPAVRGARSVLYDGGSLYVGRGSFWYQDAAGNTTGPQ